MSYALLFRAIVWQSKFLNMNTYLSRLRSQLIEEL